MFPLLNHPRGGAEGCVGSQFIVVEVTVLFLKHGDSNSDYIQAGKRREVEGKISSVTRTSGCTKGPASGSRRPHEALSHKIQKPGP